MVSEKDLRILQAIECSSMVSAWKEYLCLEMRAGRAVLSKRRYEVLGEVSDFAVETGEGGEEYRIPDVIDGKRVVGTEDEFIVGGELTADPSDTHSEIDLADVDRDALCAWLTERRFELNSELEQIWGGTPLEGRVPNVLGGEELEEPGGGAGPARALDTAMMAPVTPLRIRLQRWMDFAATPENDYPAEVIKEGDSYCYKARGVSVPITEHEAVQVISNPFLYYFSTALQLQKRIDQKMAETTSEVTHSNVEARRERKTEGKREAVLLRISDPFCKREFKLIRTSTNRYALRFCQVFNYKEDRVRIPPARGLKSGAEIWEALIGMITSLGAFELAEDDVDDIAANVSMIDLVLAEEVRRAASEWFTEWNC